MTKNIRNLLLSACVIAACIFPNSYNATKLKYGQHEFTFNDCEADHKCPTGSGHCFSFIKNEIAEPSTVKTIEPSKEKQNGPAKDKANQPANEQTKAPAKVVEFYNLCVTKSFYSQFKSSNKVTPLDIQNLPNYTPAQIEDNCGKDSQIKKVGLGYCFKKYFFPTCNSGETCLFKNKNNKEFACQKISYTYTGRKDILPLYKTESNIHLCLPPLTAEQTREFALEEAKITIKSLLEEGNTNPSLKPKTVFAPTNKSNTKRSDASDKINVHTPPNSSKNVAPTFVSPGKHQGDKESLPTLRTSVTFGADPLNKPVDRENLSRKTSEIDDVKPIKNPAPVQEKRDDTVMEHSFRPPEKLIEEERIQKDLLLSTEKGRDQNEASGLKTKDALPDKLFEKKELQTELKEEKLGTDLDTTVKLSEEAADLTRPKEDHVDNVEEIATSNISKGDEKGEEFLSGLSGLFEPRDEDLLKGQTTTKKDELEEQKTSLGLDATKTLNTHSEPPSINLGNTFIAQEFKADEELAKKRPESEIEFRNVPLNKEGLPLSEDEIHKLKLNVEANKELLDLI